MNLKKHRESVFKSFRENKKEIKRAEKDIKWKEWFNSTEQVEGRRQMRKHMEWALLAWDLDQMLRKLVKYHPEEYDHKALDHIREEIHNIMEEKGLQFPA